MGIEVDRFEIQHPDVGESGKDTTIIVAKNKEADVFKILIQVCASNRSNVQNEVENVTSSTNSETQNLMLSVITESEMAFPLLESIGISLKDIGFNCMYNYIENSTNFYAKCQTQIGETCADVFLIPPIRESDLKDVWCLRAASKIDLVGWLKDVIKFLEGAGVEKLLDGLSVDKLFPEELHKMPVALQDFEIQFNPVEPKINNISLKIKPESAWQITDFLAINNLDIDMLFDFYKSNPSFHSQLNGSIEIGKLNLVVEGQRQENGWLLKGNSKQGEVLSLAELTNSLLSPCGIKLLQGMPDIELWDITFTIDTGTNSYFIEGSTNVEIADAFALKNIKLEFHKEEIHDWVAVGKLTTVLFGYECDLVANAFSNASAFPNDTAINYIFEWESATPIPIISIGDMATLTISALKLGIVIQETNTMWVLSSAGGLGIKDFLNMSGSLSFYDAGSQKGLVFAPDNAMLDIDIPLVTDASEQNLHVNIRLSQLAIIKDDSSWKFKSEVSTSIKGLPQPIDSILPDTIDAALIIDRHSACIICAPLINVTIPFPVFDPESSNLTTKDANITIADLKIMLSKDFGISTIVALELPWVINNLLGEKGDEDNIKIPNFQISFNVGYSVTEGLFFELVSPIASNMQSKQEDGKTWMYLNLGDFGEIRFAPLILKYNGTDFVAQGEFEQVRPLALPSRFLKNLFNQKGSPEVADNIPNILPLTEFSVLDSENQLDYNAFIEVLEGISKKTGIPFVADQARSALETIAKKFSSLPEKFKEYFEVVLPKSFKFNIAITPGSELGIRCSINTGDDQPLKIVYPTLIGITAIKLKKFVLGEIFGGALLTLEVDIEIDSADYATLVASLETSERANDGTDVNNKLVMNNLFMLIVYQNAIPIPIPLFYNNLGFSYSGFKGIESEVMCQFPKPVVNYSNIMNLLKEIYPFFTNAEAELDPHIFERYGLGLNFSINPGFIKLPEYLGGRTLGKREELWKISISETVAKLLNDIKKTDILPLLTLLPLDKRVGIQDISFGCMNFQVAWIVATFEEFGELLNAYSGELPLSLQKFYSLPIEQRQKALQLIQPNASGEVQKRVGILLSGEWKVEEIATLQAQFGLIVSKTEIPTRFRISGQLSELLNIELVGGVGVNIQSERFFEITGYSQLAIHGYEVFKGDLQMANDYFYIKGNLNLFTSSSPIYGSGDVEGKLSATEFYLKGGIRFGIGNFFELVGANVVITRAGIQLVGTWGACKTVFAITRERDGLLIYGEVAPIQIGSIFSMCGLGKFGGPMASISTGAKPQIKLNGSVTIFDISQKVEFSLSDDGFYFPVAGKIFGLFECALDIKGNDLMNKGLYVKASMKSDFLTCLKTNAREIIMSQANNAVSKIQYAQKRLEVAKVKVASLGAQVTERYKVFTEMKQQAKNDLCQLQESVKDAQSKVNSIQAEIDFTKGRIVQLKNEIIEWKQWLDNAPWEEAWYRVGKFDYEVGWRSAEISALYVKLGTLEATQFTASTVLESFKQAVGEVEKRVNDLYNRDSLSLILMDAKEFATKALEVANSFLQAQRNIIGGLADIGVKIISVGVENVLNIEEACFEGNLFNVQSGNVNLAVRLKFMGEEKQLNLNINLRDTATIAQNLARILLG